ncbi:MAG: aminoglycoside 6-adenylyltransferase [Caldilineaceae bacterium]
MELQTTFIDQLTTLAKDDPRVRAVWLAGSFGKGIADQFSDVDAHLLLTETALEDFRQGVRAWLEQIRPLVLFRLMFDGQMVNALTVDGLRLDLWLHTGDAADVPQGATRVLWQQEDVLRWIPAPSPQLTRDEVTRQLEWLIPEFWRCIAMLPVVWGRGERIVGVTGAMVEIQVLTDVFIAGAGVRNDRGAKARNDFLPADLRAAVESAIYLPELTDDALVQLHLRLARLMQQHGPILCARWQIEYPQQIEDTALNYVRQFVDDVPLKSA